MFAELLSLLGVLTLGLLSPGPDFLVVVKNALGRSRATAFATVGGIALGLAVQFAIIVFGFTTASPNVLRAVQWIGATFLAYVGVRALFARPEPDGKAEGVVPEVTEGAAGSTGGLRLRPAPTEEASGPALPRSDSRRGFVEGLLCNLTNPKAFLFFVSLYAQFARGGRASGGDAELWRVAFPVVAVAHGIVAWSLVVLAVRSEPVARRLRRAQRWLPRAFGAALIALAAWTAWSALAAR